MRENILSVKATESAKHILMLVRRLKITSDQYEILSQLTRSATSVSVNIEEAIAAQSRKDFIAKLCISRKELRETMKWLEFLEHLREINTEEYIELIKEFSEIYKILNSSISTAKGNDLRR